MEGPDALVIEEENITAFLFHAIPIVDELLIYKKRKKKEEEKTRTIL